MRKIPVKYFDPGKKVYWRGRWFDEAYVEACVDAERELGYKEYFYQGSYNVGGVAASAGTHDGGGCGDKVSKGLASRRAHAKRGTVYCPRTRAQGFSPHDHGWQQGNKKAARGLKAQMISWGLYGRNGLASNGADDSGVRDVFKSYPDWKASTKVRKADFYLDGANKALKYGNTVRKYASIELMQTALNKIPGGKKLVVDGYAGPLTTKEFNLWRASRFKGVTHGPIGVRSAKLLFKEAKMPMNVRATQGGKAL